MEPDAAEQTWSPAEKAWRIAVSRGVADGLSPIAATIARECFMAGRESIASPSEISDVLNAAAEILLGWGYHDSYAESGRGQIAVQELRGLADRFAALRTTKEGE